MIAVVFLWFHSPVVTHRGDCGVFKIADWKTKNNLQNVFLKLSCQEGSPAQFENKMLRVQMVLPKQEEWEGDLKRKISGTFNSVILKKTSSFSPHGIFINEKTSVFLLHLLHGIMPTLWIPRHISHNIDVKMGNESERVTWRKRKNEAR